MHEGHLEALGQGPAPQCLNQQQGELAAIQQGQGQGIEHRQVDRNQGGVEEQAAAPLAGQGGTHFDNLDRPRHLAGGFAEIGDQAAKALECAAGERD